MRIIQIFLFFLFNHLNINKVTGICNPDTKNIEVKLKHDLLCNYKKDERPHQLLVPVELNYAVKSFEFVSKYLIIYFFTSRIIPFSIAKVRKHINTQCSIANFASLGGFTLEME